MIRRIAAGFVFVMAFLLVVAEVQRYDDRAETEFQQEQ